MKKVEIIVVNISEMRSDRVANLHEKMCRAYPHSANEPLLLGHWKYLGVNYKGIVRFWDNIDHFYNEAGGKAVNYITAMSKLDKIINESQVDSLKYLEYSFKATADAYQAIQMAAASDPEEAQAILVEMLKAWDRGETPEFEYSGV